MEEQWLQELRSRMPVLARLLSWIALSLSIENGLIRMMKKVSRLTCRINYNS